MPSFFFHELWLITVLLLIWDSYMSWSTRLFSLKLCVRFSNFNSVSLLSKFIFLFNKMHWPFDFKISQFLSGRKQEKNHTRFCSQTSDFWVARRRKSMISVWDGAPKKFDLVTIFFNLENLRSENFTFSQ